MAFPVLQLWKARLFRCRHSDWIEHNPTIQAEHAITKADWMKSMKTFVSVDGLSVPPDCSDSRSSTSHSQICSKCAVADGLYPLSGCGAQISRHENMEIGEFGVGRQDFGGRWPRRGQLAEKAKDLAAFGAGVLRLRAVPEVPADLRDGVPVQEPGHGAALGPDPLHRARA